MKRGAFRLEAVLRVRRIQEELARVEVAAANRRVADAEDAADRRIERYRRGAEIALPERAGDLAPARERLGWRAQSVLDARHAVDAATLAREGALGEWRDRHRRVDGLERLEARHHEAHAREDLRRAELEVAELVAARRRGGAR